MGSFWFETPQSTSTEIVSWRLKLGLLRVQDVMLHNSGDRNSGDRDSGKYLLLQ